MASPCSDISFASGPAMLPAEVKEALGAELGRVAELPFSGPRFRAVMERAEERLRRLLGLSGQWRVLFLAGGASGQFCAVPMNLTGAGGSARYVLTGLWSRRAAEWAAPLCTVHGDERDSAAYCHVTTNESADGLRLIGLPETRAPLVADMSSDLLTGPVDLSPFSLVYASGAKNLGAAGLAVVLVRDDVLGRARAGTPPPWDYGRQAEAGSRVNTPPMLALAVAERMLAWLEDQGLERVAARNRRRAEALYEALDRWPDLFRSPVPAAARSLANVRFHLPTPALEREFLAAAERAGLSGLQGHSAVGGLRASLTNALPEGAVTRLVAVMAEFAERAG
jgi:phosphoserine aminotransferase